jgi:hypothetical protein
MIRNVAWVAATTLGLIVGGFILHFPGSFGGLARWDVSATIFGAILGFITGVFIGLGQWAALLLPRLAGGRLLLAMGIGIGITHAVNDGGPNAMTLLGVSVLSGIGMTAGYATLDERRAVALATCFVAWTGGLLLAEPVVKALGMTFPETPVGWSTHHAMTGLIVGIVWSIATAAVGLPALLQGRDRTVDADAGLAEA